MIAIRELARIGMTHRALASKFGVSHNNIGYIISYEEWNRLLRKPPADARGSKERESRGL